ncbi:helix-turn-helix domain-containing protein [Hymenobacter perfusus]|uniref:Helix-turn-helix domain-containing protein n=1 Tax=Hymenobacter perfusus TaxID=1236770 RepID=A0A428KIT3_9BACT|nr:helix-turn-helix domain-containing protein [Hymenobacter perfusus]RSK46379.1 helix-turn-helix domain-containing protein [Hymenobacter perfusus]
MAHEIVSQISQFNVTDLKLKGFKAYEIFTKVDPVPTYSRRDFYKICLTTGHILIHYADRSVELNGPTLFFGNPHVPYSSEILSEEHRGYACLFTEAFIKASDRSDSLPQSPLFKIGQSPVFKLTAAQNEFLTGIFQKMLAEQSADYSFKNDLVRTYIQLLLHEAMRMEPSESFQTPKNASSRIATLFLELLERLFPVESPRQMLPLKTAQDFADRLSIHTNHLNRAVKEITGKPTSTHIADRLVSEAKALLLHTDWSVGDIAYSLGFEYPTYFNNFFKKHTGRTPLACRKGISDLK